ncbi:MAG: DUF1616 domain-containing protein, partial [Solirubrobacterales bacterium]
VSTSVTMPRPSMAVAVSVPERVIVAVPLTLFLPGYAIAAVSFMPRELAPPKLWTLSVGVSLMVLALGALFLNIFPFGLTTLSWAVLLVLVIVPCCRAAALRRGRPGQRRQPARRAWRPSPVGTGLVVVAVVISIGALVLAQKPLPAGNAVGFTALWMLPANPQEGAVVVGVLSSQQDPADYTLQIAQSGQGAPRTYRLALGPGEEKTFEVPVPRRPGGRAHVVASLYLASQPRHLYRRVTTWLPRQKTFPQQP